jgi:splicing factor 1
MKLRKTFVPPNDYRPMKRSRKIYLTDAMYTPDINYIGLIIGPKGI